MTYAPTKTEVRRVDSVLAAYEAAKPLIQQFQNQLVGAISGFAPLTPHVHSIKARLKDPQHLRDKLYRKLESSRSKKEAIGIDASNFLTRINDLTGIRVLHLYTRQIRDIDQHLRAILTEQQFALLEGPSARTWDDESRAFFRACGINTQDSPSLYTSVHYVVGSASRTTITCEIQVRTLMEEVWGEVDHAMNYPHQSTSLACREQLKVLARVTSSATRLVDSIFLSLADHRELASATRRARPHPRKPRHLKRTRRAR